jgi:hypothetical protein
MLENCFPIFAILNARDRSGMLQKESPEPPEDQRVSGRIFSEKAGSGMLEKKSMMV